MPSKRTLPSPRRKRTTLKPAPARQLFQASVSDGTPADRSVRLALGDRFDFRTHADRMGRRAARGKKIDPADVAVLLVYIDLLRDDLEEALDALGEYEDDIEDLEGGDHV